jgi:hypothetical protein
MLEMWLRQLDAQASAHTARVMRGPWWWRLRCWASDKLVSWGIRLGPRDRSSMSWVDVDEDGREVVCIAQIRRKA